MVLMIVRDLLFLFMLVGFVYLLIKRFKKILRHEEVDAAVEDIKDTMKTAKEIPEVKKEEVDGAKQKIKDTLKMED